MNWTQEQKAVSEERRGTGSKPGHDIAVFEIIDHGMQFVGMAREGEHFQPKKKSFFGPLREYASYAVNNNPNLRFKFTQRFDHMSASHSFDLTFIVDYRVSDPAAIVTKLSDDPLNMMREKIKTVLGHAVTQLPWDEILKSKLQNNFSVLARKVTVGDNIDQLEKFATEYGIELKGIETVLSLTSEDIEPLRKQSAFVRKETIAEIEKQEEEAKIARALELAGRKHPLDKQNVLNQRELDRLRNQGELETTGFRAMGKAIDQIAAEIRTPDPLVRAMEIIGQTFQGGPGAVDGRAGMLQDGLSSSNHVALIGSGSESGQGLATVLGEALRRFGQRKTHSLDRQFLSNILHWIAENYLGREADEKQLNAYRLAVEEMRARVPSGIDSESYTWLQRLLDPQDLQTRLA